MNWIKNHNIILASKSPRRQQLLRELGFDFTIKTIEVEEKFPLEMSMEEIPVFLAELKANPFEGKLADNDLLITADTIVWHENKVLGKPENKEQAIEMLSSLSNCEHQVVTGVCLKSLKKQKSFNSVSNVIFKKLTADEINYYIDNYKPYDKAGAYGIQEWIGYIGVSHIEGSFFNVMGLPVQKLYSELLIF
ncbi:MAG: septum formation protein Maf [Mariniphaga sp.]|nr:septum formation protein Maf [Mariniphaga sp.]